MAFTLTQIKPTPKRNQETHVFGEREFRHNKRGVVVSEIHFSTPTRDYLEGRVTKGMIEIRDAKAIDRWETYYNGVGSFTLYHGYEIRIGSAVYSVRNMGT